MSFLIARPTWVEAGRTICAYSFALGIGKDQTTISEFLAVDLQGGCADNSVTR